MKQRMVSLVFFLILALAVCTSALAAEDTFAFDRDVNLVFEGETLTTVLERSGAAAQGEVSYTSSSEKIAVVDQNGVVTGVEKGRATITATLETDAGRFRATLPVTVGRRVSSIEMNEDSLTVYASDDPAVAALTSQPLPADVRVLVLPLGRSQRLGITALPATASDRSVLLTSDNEEICTISTNNTLKPAALGECNLILTSEQTPSVTTVYHLIVVQPITKLTLSLSEKEIFVGGSSQVLVEYAPETATVKQARFSSRNEKVATVDEAGVITGVSKGSATIDVTAADGSNKKASIRVTVQQQPESIELSDSSLTLNVGKTKRLTAKVLPAATSNKGVTWSSSNESVATVSTNGTIKGIYPGTCTITCTSKALPSVSASATVEIRQPVTRISFPEKSISFNVNTTCQVYWQIEPANATNQAVTFSSNNEDVATVDSKGLITGHKKGSCTITVKAADGSGKKGSIKVNILQPVTGVHMSKDTYRVGIDEGTRIHAVMEPENASNTGMNWTIADPSIASVKGKNNKPVVTGKRWGTTTITGVTDDGGYTTTAIIKTGNYDKALSITDLYLTDNKIKISVKNESNMNVTKFFYTISCYDMHGVPVVCNTDGSSSFEGSYGYTLYEGDSTTHGKFYFGDFVQPETLLGKVTMTITGYRTDDGYSRTIPSEKRQTVEFVSPLYSEPVPTVNPQ